MNILYIPNKDPRHTNGGNEQRTHFLWESLKKYGRVYTFLADASLISTEERIDGVNPIYKYRPICKKRSIWYILNYFIEWLSVFSVFRKKAFSCPNPLRVFEGIHFDVVILRYVHPACYYNYWEIAPMLIDIDDYPEQVFSTIRRKNLPFCLRSLGAIVTKWQTRYIISKTVGGWIANQDQVCQCGNNYYFLPNIPQPPMDSYDVDCIDRKDLFTVGVMGYKPNSEGVSLFLKRIWPSFHKKHPTVNYYIVGKGAHDEDKQFWASFEGVEYLGFVDNLEELYQKTLATVVPVYSGGGTCIKTIESMAFSRMCITTVFGARGLTKNVIDEEKGIVVFHDDVSFINCFEKIQNEAYRKEKEKLGREVIQDFYTRSNFEKATDVVLKNILGDVHC